MEEAVEHLSGLSDVGSRGLERPLVVRMTADVRPNRGRGATLPQLAGADKL
jgi:hypothetical protein